MFLVLVMLICTHLGAAGESPAYAGPTATDVCAIGATGYPTLDDALAAVSSGQTATITLLANIPYNKCLAITDGRNITFKLNGHTLTVTNNDTNSNYGSGLNVTKGRVDYQGPGAFNVSGVGPGVRVYPANGDDTASATVSSAINTSASGVGASASNGGSIVVNGPATGGYGGASAGSAGNASAPSSSVIVNGNATGAASDGFGASAGENGNVTINGTAQGGRYGAHANGSNSQVTIIDDAIGTDSYSHGAHAEGGGVIHVTGNVQGGQYGVVAGIDSVVEVGKNVTVTANANGWGVNATNDATVTVGGNIIASGSSLGVFASGSTVTVDGAIQAQPSRYIQIFDTAKQQPEYFDGSPESRTDPSTEAGYYTYSDTSKTSTVWVKVPSTSVWPAGSSLTASGTTDTSTVLTWTAATGALDYAIYKNNAFAGAPGKVLTYTVTGLSPDTEYTFKVQAAYLPAGATSATWTTDGPSINVRTNAPLPKAATPSASFTATDFYSGTLAGLNVDMHYSVNNGGTWYPVTGATMTIYNVTAAKGIWVKQLGDGTTTTDSDIQIITVTQAAVPTGLSSANCTIAAQNDGRLIGLSTEMEYKLTNATHWISGIGGAVTGLTNGTYYVRVKAVGTQLASEEAELVILPYGLTIIPVPTGISGLKWTGREQIGVAGGTGYTLGGIYQATDVSVMGYNATATLQAGYAWADGTTVVKNILWNIGKGDAPAAPTGLSGVAPTSVGGSNGKITGTTATMEYANNTGFANATDCSANETTGLAAGTYYVRMRASVNQEAGTYATITLQPYQNTGGSSGGGASSIPDYTAYINAGGGSDTTLPVTVNKNSGSAVVDIGIGNGLMSGGKTIVVTVPSVPNVDTYMLGVPVPSLSTPNEQGAMVFKTSKGSVTVPSNMLTGVAGISGSKAQITIGQGDKESLPADVKAAIGGRPLVQLTLTIDGKQTDWSNPAAPVTVSIPYTPTAQELVSPEHITVWYIDGSGRAAAMDGRYDPLSGTVIFSTNHFSLYAVVYDPVVRLDGTDRIDTALRIAQAAYPGKINSAVLTTANSYPDALAGSVLAYQHNAPILLVGSSAGDQAKVIDYLKANLEQEGTVYILGGTAVIGSGVDDKIRNSGFNHITRIAGETRYDTAAKIAEHVNVNTGTAVVLVSGENYPDALAVSSVAAQNQFPILLVQKDGIAEAVSQELAALKPSKIYIIGLEGAISPAVESQAAKITGLAAENIARIGGADRYATSLAIAEYFNLGSQTLCIATGNNFPDALAGSVYAAKYKAPIILTDSSLSAQTADYAGSRKPSEATIFGGAAVVGKDIEQQLRQLLK